jgi:hypothetical protein
MRGLQVFFGEHRDIRFNVNASKDELTIDCDRREKPQS